MAISDTTLGKILILKQDPNNIRDIQVVAVFKEGYVLGHIPYYLSPIIKMFLRS